MTYITFCYIILVKLKEKSVKRIDKMREDYIEKFRTDDYILGSFDVYKSDCIDLMKRNLKWTYGKAEEFLSRIPTAYRAAIVKIDGEFSGYIGLYDLNEEMQSASVRLEKEEWVTKEESMKIIDVYARWLVDSLNIKHIKECEISSKNYNSKKINKEIKRKEETWKYKYLFEGVDDEDKGRFLEKSHPIEKLNLVCTIKSDNKTIGIAGLINLIRSNRRAEICLILKDEDFSQPDILLLCKAIDEYLDYVHKNNIYNIIIRISGSDALKKAILEKTSMNYCARIPFSSIRNGKLEDTIMYQHIPGMIKDDKLTVPENISVDCEVFKTEKKECSEIIPVLKGYRLVSPKIFDKLKINIDDIVNGHAEAMKKRNNYAIPLGEDKYFLQKGNEKYGIYKAVSNFNYVLLDTKDRYAGYVNILRSTANGLNVELEIGIVPGLQNMGMGTAVMKKFYKEVFSVGCASVTSMIFEFNKPSINLHKKFAEYNGLRKEAYYINGRLWDIVIYSKVNDKII